MLDASLTPSPSALTEDPERRLSILMSIWGSWEPPEGAYQFWLVENQARVAAALIQRMSEVVDEAWADELPALKRDKAHKDISVSVRRALKLLLAKKGPVVDRVFEASVPAEFLVVGRAWEPAEASGPLPAMPEKHLQAYRWVAAILAGYAHNGLKKLQVRYISDARMPALNRGLRRVALDVLLADSGAAYQLAKWPYRLLCLADNGYPVDAPSWVL